MGHERLHCFQFQKHLEQCDRKRSWLIMVLFTSISFCYSNSLNFKLKIDDYSTETLKNALGINKEILLLRVLLQFWSMFLLVPLDFDWFSYFHLFFHTKYSRKNFLPQNNITFDLIYRWSWWHICMELEPQQIEFWPFHLKTVFNFLNSKCVLEMLSCELLTGRKNDRKRKRLVFAMLLLPQSLFLYLRCKSLAWSSSQLKKHLFIILRAKTGTFPGIKWNFKLDHLPINFNYAKIIVRSNEIHGFVREIWWSEAFDFWNRTVTWYQVSI